LFSSLNDERVLMYYHIILYMKEMEAEAMRNIQR